MIIDEIISILSSDQGNVIDGLLKTKVLLHRIGHKELVEWVNSELNGYDEKKELPSYRILNASILANVSNARWRVTSHPIPLAHLTDAERDILERIPVRDSLTVVSKLASSDGGVARINIGPEFNRRLGQSTQGNVEMAWSQISAVEFDNIIFQVKSRLLDFVLDLKDSVGDVSDEADLKMKTSAIDAPALFNHAVFGPNTTIIVGHGNIQNATVVNEAEAIKNLLELYRANVGATSPQIEAEVNEIVAHAKSGNSERVRSAFRKLFGTVADVVKPTATAILTALAKQQIGL